MGRVEQSWLQQSQKSCFAKAASEDLKDPGQVSTTKLYEHSCAGDEHRKITPSNASKSPDLGTAVLSDNTLVRLTCVIWDEFELGWKQVPSERSLRGASADTAVAGWLPAEDRWTWGTSTVLKPLNTRLFRLKPAFLQAQMNPCQQPAWTGWFKSLPAENPCH